MIELVKAAEIGRCQITRDVLPGSVLVITHNPLVNAMQREARDLADDVQDKLADAHFRD